MFGGHGKALSQSCVTFVSKWAYDHDIAEHLGLERVVLPVSHCRDISKRDMRHNDTLADIRVDPETYTVTVDGKRLHVSRSLNWHSHSGIFCSEEEKQHDH